MIPRQVCYNRVARGMAHQHRLTLALLLTRIRLRGATGPAAELDAEFDFLIRGKEGLVTQRPANRTGLTEEQAENMIRLAQRWVVRRGREGRGLGAGRGKREEGRGGMCEGHRGKIREVLGQVIAMRGRWDGWYMRR